MNESKLIARKLQMARLGLLPVDLSRKQLQIEWKKLVKAGKIPGMENEMTRRSSRARPGRKNKKPTCVNCGSRSGEYHNFGLCNECESKQDKPEEKKMNIPKMTEKE
ncbi:MAG: hypothetical protein QQN63_13955 [Nitrosopumilus sp.]